MRRKKGRKKKKIKNKTVRIISPFSKDEIVEIQGKAYYQALKQLEMDKEEQQTQEAKEHLRKKEVWWKTLLLILNIFFFPFHLCSKLYNGKMPQILLNVIVTIVLMMIGVMGWVLGMIVIGGFLLNGFTVGWSFTSFILVFLCSVVLLPFGSMFIVASNDLGKVEDSRTLESYCASIMSSLAVVLAMVSLFVSAVQK